MSYQPTPAGGYQIDVLGATTRAYQSIGANFALLVEFAWLPLAIVWGFAVLASLINGGRFGRLLASLFDAIGFLVFGTTFLVRCHRFALLGERDAVNLFPPGWGDFFITGVKLGACVFVASIVLGLIVTLPPHMLTVPLALIGYFVVAFASMRVSLAFPAAAIAQPMALREAWDRAAGNYWRLVGGLILCYLPFAIIDMILLRLGLGSFWLTWLIFEAIRLAVTFVGLAVIASFLSEAYTGIVHGGEVRPAR
jgi:hypothetical protein